MKKIAILLLALFLLAGCSSFQSSQSGEFSSSGVPAPEYDMMTENSVTADRSMMESESIVAQDESGYVEGVEQKVIKTGTLALHMESVQEGVELIKTKVAEWGGDTINSNVTRYDNSYYADMTVRVPSEQFDSAMSGLKELALYVSSEYTNADNITEAYMDLEARLNNLKEEEQQYLAILDKAVTVEEILQVTDYLSTVRYEIESAEGQLKYYDSNVDYSTISLALTEDESVAAAQEAWLPLSTFREALSEWVVFLQGLTDSVIYLAIFGWPVLVLILIVSVWRRRHHAKRHK
ncbi:MAG: DUF4349 domain-containing protein [Candidatus Gracilibacteria bacterium]